MVFFGYLGALIGGIFLLWNHLAANKEGQAKAAIIALTTQIELLKTLETAAPCGFATLIKKNENHIPILQEILAEAQGYQCKKGWLGWVCLAFVLVSAACQLIGASDGG